MNQYLLANLISHNSSYPTFCRADRDSKTASTLFLRRHSKGHGVTIVTDTEFRSYHLASCSFSASVNHVTYGNVTHLSCWQPSSRSPIQTTSGTCKNSLVYQSANRRGIKLQDANRLLGRSMTASWSSAFQCHDFQKLLARMLLFFYDIYMRKTEEFISQKVLSRKCIEKRKEWKNIWKSKKKSYIKIFRPKNVSSDSLNLNATKTITDWKLNENHDNISSLQEYWKAVVCVGQNVVLKAVQRRWNKILHLRQQSIVQLFITVNIYLFQYSRNYIYNFKIRVSTKQD